MRRGLLELCLGVSRVLLISSVHKDILCAAALIGCHILHLTVLHGPAQVSNVQIQRHSSWLVLRALGFPQNLQLGDLAVRHSLDAAIWS